jgi:hypothetical protein
MARLLLAALAAAGVCTLCTAQIAAQHGANLIGALNTLEQRGRTAEVRRVVISAAGRIAIAARYSKPA